MKMPRLIREEIIIHAKHMFPYECVGLVAVDRNNEAKETHPAANIAAAPAHTFEIDPEEQLRLLNDMEDKHLRLGAIYHSHPKTRPVPSQTDIMFARGWPGVLWIIIGPELEMRVWRIINDRTEGVLI